MADKILFVTVGTTEFDKLIQRIAEPDFQQILHNQGYKTVVLQIGTGKFEPSGSFKGIKLEYYRFKETLAEDIARADLVISHAGAGTCLEVLDAGKPLVVVINSSLMDNHQSELAEALNHQNYATACTMETLQETLERATYNFNPYPRADPSTFINFLNGVMGVD